jgi:uncharacterized protein involved in type VI secretion and phage assembly
MSTLLGIIQQIVRAELRCQHVAELGVVERNGLHPHSGSADHDNYACDVRLKNTGLLLQQVPVATGHIGTAAIPNEGDLVLLGFSHGDINQPIIIGRLYNDVDRPPLNQADQIIFRQPLAESDDKTVKAEISNLDERDPPRLVLLELPPKVSVTVQDDEIVAESGETRLRLSQPDGGGGQVVVEAGRSRITLNQDGDITIDAAGSITLTTSTGDVSISGMNVSIKSQLRTTVEAGTEAQISANVGATVNGGLSVSLQGVSLSLRGLTSFSP